MSLSVKDEPELRHVLAHVVYAIQALAKGNSGEALYELASIEGLVFWDNDAAMAAHANELMKGQTDGEELQGQEREKLPEQNKRFAEVLQSGPERHAGY